jgi:hypothetical protein
MDLLLLLLFNLHALHLGPQLRVALLDGVHHHLLHQVGTKRVAPLRPCTVQHLVRHLMDVGMSGLRLSRLAEVVCCEKCERQVLSHMGYHDG